MRSPKYCMSIMNLSFVKLKTKTKFGILGGVHFSIFPQQYQMTSFFSASSRSIFRENTCFFWKKTEIGYPQQPQMTSFFSASWSLESLSLHHVWEGQFLEKIGVFLKKIRKLKKGTSFATFFIFTAGLTAPYREFPIGNFKNPYREFPTALFATNGTTTFEVEVRFFQENFAKLLKNT